MRAERTCAALKRELGEATFGSWLGQAALRERGDELCLVAATGVARDWIRRHAWRRIGELWAQNDPMGRNLELKSRMEYEAEAPTAPAAPVVLKTEPMAAAPASAAGAPPPLTAASSEWKWVGTVLAQPHSSSATTPRRRERRVRAGE